MLSSASVETLPLRPEPFAKVMVFAPPLPVASRTSLSPDEPPAAVMRSSRLVELPAVPLEESAVGALTADSAARAAQLAALLTASDGASLDYLSSHAAAIRPLFADGGYRDFERALNEFDFDAALRLLQGAAAARGLATNPSSPKAMT